MYVCFGLDPENDVDHFCLHYIFIPRINNSLHRFQSAWNNNPLSTEGNRSPMQLYLSNSVGSTMFADDNPADLHSYGQDPEALLLLKLMKKALLLSQKHNFP